jgi:molybdenum cofactor sulfurtransferase
MPLALLRHVGAEPGQDGTVNYLGLPAVVNGLYMHSQYLPALPLRLAALTDFLASRLSELKHAGTTKPFVSVLSARPRSLPVRLGEQSDTGSIVSFLMLEVSDPGSPVSRQ